MKLQYRRIKIGLSLLEGLKLQLLEDECLRVSDCRSVLGVDRADVEGAKAEVRVAPCKV